MRVLVTGGAGYIGCLVVEELLEKGHQPVLLDILYWGKKWLEPYIDRIKLVEGDCRNSRDVVYALEKIDAVVHLAGIVGEPACKISYPAHVTNNILATKNLVECCTDPNLELVQDFIYLSSCSVYGNVKGIFDEVTEDAPANPLSLYADAKIQCERIIFEKAMACSHFHPTVLRLTTVFGWSPRQRIDLVTNLFAYKAWKEGKITIFGDGAQYRSLVHVKDVAKAIVHTLDSPRFKRDGKIFHVGEESNNKTVREIAEIVKGYLPSTEIEFLEGEPTDKRDYRINCQKIKNLLGWKFSYTVEKGVEELIRKFESLELDWESPIFRNNLYQYS